MALFDIYVAKVFFANPEEGFEWKPVVQIKDNPELSNSFAVITSHPPRSHYHGEVLVEDFEACGLTKRSTIRLTQRIDNPTKKRRIGTLTPKIAALVEFELFRKHRIEHDMTEDYDDEFSIHSILEGV